MKWRTFSFAIMACLLAVGVAATQDMPAKTASGTVVSSSSTQLVIDTDTGRRTFDVDAQSNFPAGLTVGSRVEVDYHEMAGGRLHLATVRTSSMSPDRPVAGTAPAPRTETTATGTTATGTTTAPETTAAPRTTTATPADDEPARTRRTGSLPRTASPLPLVGLVGLLSLAGGVALRRR